MRIRIDYEASWRNSFLSGNNDEPLPKKGRNYIGSMKELKKNGNFITREVTDNTVLGVLNRLIGDQRKLYQSRANLSDNDHYFEKIMPLISFKDNPDIINQEITYLRNMKGSTDQNSYTGMIKVNDPVFTSDYSEKFWGVLALPLEQLIDFIIDDIPISTTIACDPLVILDRLEKIKKIYKPIKNELKGKQAADHLSSFFKKYKPIDNQGLIKPLPMYCSSLYLQRYRLEKAGFDLKSTESSRGGITGISNNGFTPKDFMDRYTTGNKKLLYGNPYIRETYQKGEGKVKSLLTKASGKLDIIIEVDRNKAKEIQTLIENAGVSAFYLGKKGLAYVSDIRLQEGDDGLLH